MTMPTGVVRTFVLGSRSRSHLGKVIEEETGTPRRQQVLIDEPNAVANDAESRGVRRARLELRMRLNVVLPNGRSILVFVHPGETLGTSSTRSATRKE